MKNLTVVAIGVMAFSGSALAAESKEAALGLFGAGGPVVNGGGAQGASIQSTAPAAAAVTSTAPAGPATKSPVAGGATTGRTITPTPAVGTRGSNGTELNPGIRRNSGGKTFGPTHEPSVVVGVSLEGARVER
jgi:hypothetical protein